MSKVDEILASRRATAPVAEEEGKFFSTVATEGADQNFLELRFRIGLKTCFAYSDLTWFNYDPEEGCLDLEFGGYMVTVRGRGLGEKLFNGIKQKRIGWIKEADSEMQDNKENETYIEAINVTPLNSADSGEA